jgi:neutral ceramidase
MIRFPLRSFVVLLFVLALRSSLSAEQVMAGVAVVDITPPVGGHLIGYGSPNPTDGVQFPITARILLLESGATSVAIVVWDLCVHNSPWLHEQMAGLGIDRLLLLNTHTHAGPHIDEPDFPASGTTLRAGIEQKILAAIKEAKQQMFPASFTVGHGSLQLGYNRLVRQPDGFTLTHFDNPERIPYGPVDPTVDVLRITDDGGAVRAVVVNYACHSVVLGFANRKLSADYPGAMRAEVESKLGGNAVCIFVQGAAGEINPLMQARSDDRASDLPVVERMGKALAGEVMSVLNQLGSRAEKGERLALESTMLTVPHRWEPSRTIKAGVTTMLLNSDIGIILFPGEAFQQFGLDWRRKAGVRHPLFFGYCSDSAEPWVGYIPDIESAARGGYGASDGTQVAVGTGERLLNEGLRQLYTMQGRLKSAPQRHLGR